MAALPHDYEEILFAKDTFYVFDDFKHYVSADDFTSVATDSGTISVLDAVGGRLTINASDGSVVDNDESYVRTTTEMFLVADNKPLRFECRMQYTEANTDDANVFVGFIDAAGANLLVDDGAGPKTTASGFGIFKVDGGTVWKCFSSKSTTQTITASTTTAGGASYQVLEVEFQPISSTEGMVYFWVDGVQLVDSNQKPISHSITFASATEMHFVPCYAKAGSANSETPKISNAFAAQLR